MPVSIYATISHYILLYIFRTAYCTFENHIQTIITIQQKHIFLNYKFFMQTLRRHGLARYINRTKLLLRPHGSNSTPGVCLPITLLQLRITELVVGLHWPALAFRWPGGSWWSWW